MDKKIVFFDIDGTLVDENTHKIPDSTREAINILRSKGHLAFINTGRPLCEISALVRSIDFDGFILGCGTYVEYNNEVLLSKTLGNELTKEIIDDIEKYNLDAVLEGRNDVFYDKPENIRHNEIHHVIEVHTTEGFYKGLTWYDREDIDIDKLVVFLNEESDFTSFYEKYKERLDFIQRADDFYEIVPKGYSKASGIEFIINYLNIPHENTYAFGDSTNDLSMLEYVKHSVAMGNSTPILFDKVEYITDNVDKDGIFNGLKHYDVI